MALYPDQAALSPRQTFLKSAVVCPCGSTLDYEACCGRYHAQISAPPDAEALMRARYSAYVNGMEAYIRATWHPRTCPGDLGMDAPPRPQWRGLDVRLHRLLNENQATVEYVARYKLNGRACHMHEISRFEFLAGQWLYVDGEQKS
jgi:SEC-C motif-containing protein